MKVLFYILVCAALLMIVFSSEQAHVIEQQRILIKQMTHNPACMVDPVELPPHITDN